MFSCHYSTVHIHFIENYLQKNKSGIDYFDFLKYGLFCCGAPADLAVQETGIIQKINLQILRIIIEITQMKNEIIRQSILLPSPKSKDGCTVRLSPAHIRTSTVDISATGFAPLHTLRHHPSDRIILMSHLQETPSLPT